MPATPDDPWIRRFHPAPDSDVRLVCFPHAGGSASFFFPVSRQLSPRLDVLALQYPGRQDRRNEPPIDSIAELADQAAEALRSWTDKPLAFFGHSMGAVLAYEVGLRLQRSGTDLVELFASGRRAPSTVRDERVHTQPDEGLIDEIKSLSGTDASLLGNEEILRMILPAIRSDYRAVETYVHQPGQRLSAPITVLVGDADPKVTLDEARKWQEHTTGAFDMKVFAGGHFYLTPHAAEVIRLIADRLDGRRVLQDTGRS
ncbi:thioesterase II family protein [Goodfellowiella coeruleoviolacea]|uniref:Surfactin synthase thioesterase subunit n=1 Tax=Goodfellowiella coeruleoviolacea TaxID=334858 RepID=A0AAE3KH47_9PSEU|nr:alpha/beta fold hydrolase [Goodfellowiella coeruleoviolacea]MCP2166462.1 Surfactin synthase thioesterase subunit [Goodfellowiella coeruleoviolacea]